eukprot:gene12392-23249_t
MSLAQYAVNVSNAGTVASDDAVLGFTVVPGAGSNGIPLQSLYAFQRVHLAPGETKTVNMYPSLLDFTAVNEHG